MFFGMEKSEIIVAIYSFFRTCRYYDVRFLMVVSIEFKMSTVKQLTLGHFLDIIRYHKHKIMLLISYQVKAN